MVSTFGSTGISVDGLISGLDTTNIINQLVAIQTQNITRLETQQADETIRINLFQTLQANALGLLSASNSLTKPSLFEGILLLAEKLHKAGPGGVLFDAHI